MRKILLVEDDSWLADMYGDCLRDGGLSVDHVSTAESALDKLAEFDYDLVILDIFLPEHSGIALLHEMASYADSESISVIMLSSVSPGQTMLSEDRWRDYGVVGHLHKPDTKPQDLLTKVKKHFSKHGAIP